MIQRIQTVYLVIAAILISLVFANPIAEIFISDELYLTLSHNSIEGSDPDLFPAQSTWPVTLLLAAILAIELVIIFSFRNRILQIRLCIFNLLLMFGVVGMIYFFTKYTLSQMEGQKSIFLWPILCPMVAIILNYLAIKAIQKDERLVRSYERIR